MKSVLRDAYLILKKQFKAEIAGCFSIYSVRPVIDAMHDCFNHSKIRPSKMHDCQTESSMILI